MSIDKTFKDSVVVFKNHFRDIEKRVILTLRLTVFYINYQFRYFFVHESCTVQYYPYNKSEFLI